MNKYEFIEQLKETLEGQVPAGVIQENITYYDSYISGEQTKGMDEASILSELGDPRLIAKTIIDTNTTDDDSRGEYDTEAEEDPFRQSERQHTSTYKQVNLGAWYWKFIGIAAVVFILFLIISVFAGILNLLFVFAGPLCIVLLVVMLIRGFKRK